MIFHIIVPVVDFRPIKTRYGLEVQCHTFSRGADNFQVDHWWLLFSSWQGSGMDILQSIWDHGPKMVWLDVALFVYLVNFFALTARTNQCWLGSHITCLKKLNGFRSLANNMPSLYIFPNMLRLFIGLCKNFQNRNHGQQSFSSHEQDLSALFWLVCRYLKLNPMYTKINGEKEYVSLKLKLAHSSVKLDTIVEASFKFLIYDQSSGKHREKLGKVANYFRWN